MLRKGSVGELLWVWDRYLTLGFGVQCGMRVREGTGLRLIGEA